MNQNRIKQFFSIKTLLLIGIIGCFICIIPFTKSLIILLMEKVLGRPLRDIAKWDSILVHSMIFFSCIMAFLFLVFYTKFGNPVKNDISENIKNIFYDKKGRLYLLILFILYFIFYWALIRANYEYADDIRRVYTGHKAWVGWSRYVSETLAVFIHTNFFINDISPITQLISIAILSVTSYILAYIVMDKNISKISLLAAVLIGLNPFFHSNFSYKFDCPYMSLAILFGIIPFLFVNNLRSYILISFMSMILVCTSYQAANSIYIILAIFTAYKMWSDNKPWKEIIKYSVISILCYGFALIFFRLFLMNTFEGDAIHRGTGIAIGEGMFSVMKSNISSYFHLIKSNYGNIAIKAFTVMIIILFPFAAINRTKKGKIQTFLFSTAILILMFLLSFGAYIALKQALIASRALMGFDVLISLIALFVVFGFYNTVKMKNVSSFLIICLFYCMGIGTTVYGTFVSKQKDYEQFRFSILIQDLSNYVDSSQHNSIYIGGYTGVAEKTRMERMNYPLTGGGLSPVLTHYFLTDWNMEFEVLSEDDLGELDLQPEFKKTLIDLPLIKDTYYHSIYGKDNQYYVYLKSPTVKEWK